MLFPGLGFSGGTLARDLLTLRGLGDQFHIDTPMLDGVQASNRAQNNMVVRRLKEIVGGKLNGRHIAVLGLTYKADTSTLRRSAALEVIAKRQPDQMFVRLSRDSVLDTTLAVQLSRAADILIGDVHGRTMPALS